MVKYKRKRHFRKKSKFIRRARRIRGKKRFERRLNSVAEKKLKWLENGDSVCSAATSTGALNYGIIKSIWPAKGSGSSDMIGSKLFIRYILVDLWIYNVNDVQRTNGLVGILYIKERRPASAQLIELKDFFFGGRPILNTDLYKNRQIKKMWLKTRHMDWNSAELPQAIHFRKRFKIMKNCSRDSTSTLPDIPDIYFAPVYFTSPFSSNGTGTAAHFCFRITMTFTDV